MYTIIILQLYGMIARLVNQKRKGKNLGWSYDISSVNGAFFHSENLINKVNVLGKLLILLFGLKT